MSGPPDFPVLPTGQAEAEERVDAFRRRLGPFVVAAENTRMAMVFTDAALGRHPLVFANDSFLALTGFKRADILGKEVAYLLKAVTVGAPLSAIEDALDEGTSGTWEAQCRRADGGEYLATIFLSPVPDEQGIVRQHFLCFVEVSGRIDRLLSQRKQFNGLYDKAPGFIATVEGRDHRYTFANNSYKRLVGKEHLIGHRVIDLFPEVAHQGFIAILDAVLETGQPFVGNNMPLSLTKGDSANPTLHYVNFVYEPVRDDQGSIIGIFCEGHDVTAERVAAQRLAALQSEIAHASRVNAMGLMAATLAHELNQPLTAISTYAGASVRLLATAGKQEVPIERALREIAEAAQRAGDIIRNVRELTRRGHSAKVRFDLREAVAECVRLVQAGGCPSAIIIENISKEIEVLAHRVQLQQVVINLLRNACDAAGGGPGGKVTIDASLRDQEVVVSVSDTGPGMSAEAAQNIFIWSDSSKESGSGLGLSISRTIIDAHGGRIWLERSDQTGSQFCFSLPVGELGAGDDR